MSIGHTLKTVWRYTLIWPFSLILLWGTHSWSLSNHVYVHNILPYHVTEQIVVAATFAHSRRRKWILARTPATLTNVLCDNRPLGSASHLTIFLYLTHKNLKPYTAQVFHSVWYWMSSLVCPPFIDHSNNTGWELLTTHGFTYLLQLCTFFIAVPTSLLCRWRHQIMVTRFCEWERWKQ